MGKWRGFVYRSLSLFVVVTLFASVSAAAQQFSTWGTQSLANDFVTENQTFAGSWPQFARWRSEFCDGHYYFLTRLKGRIGANTDFELNDDGSVDVYGDLYDVYAHVDGRYQSSVTFCREVAGWLGVRADRVQIRAHIQLPEDESTDLSKLKVVILSTKFGTIHLGKGVPRWFERMATDILNRAVVHVWHSKLGDWIAAKLASGFTQYLKHG